MLNGASLIKPANYNKSYSPPSGDLTQQGVSLKRFCDASEANRKNLFFQRRIIFISQFFTFSLFSLVCFVFAHQKSIAKLWSGRKWFSVFWFFIIKNVINLFLSTLCRNILHCSYSCRVFLSQNLSGSLKIDVDDLWTSIFVALTQIINCIRFTLDALWSKLFFVDLVDFKNIHFCPSLKSFAPSNWSCPIGIQLHPFSHQLWPASMSLWRRI